MDLFISNLFDHNASHDTVCIKQLVYHSISIILVALWICLKSGTQMVFSLPLTLVTFVLMVVNASSKSLHQFFFSFFKTILTLSLGVECKGLAYLRVRFKG